MSAGRRNVGERFICEPESFARDVNLEDVGAAPVPAELAASHADCAAPQAGDGPADTLSAHGYPRGRPTPAGAAKHAPDGSARRVEVPYRGGH